MSAAIEPRRGRRVWRALAWIVLVAIVIVGVLAWWLLRTTGGAEFVMTRALAALDGKLSVERVEGTLSGPLTLSSLHYVDTGIDARVQRATVDLAVLSLLRKQVRIERAEIDGLNLTLTTPPEKTESEAPVDQAPFSLRAPIDLYLDDAVISRAEIRQDGEVVLSGAMVRARAQWTAEGLSIAALDLKSDQGTADLAGLFGADSPYVANGQGHFAWKQGEQWWRGEMTSRRDGARLTLRVTMQEPLKAALELTSSETGAKEWSGKLGVTELDPRVFSPESPFKSFQIEAEASGNAQGGTGHARVALDQHVVELAPLSLRYVDQVLTLDQVVIATPDAPGRAEVKGQIDLRGDLPQATLELAWNEVELPADLVGQVLATHGAVRLAGNTQAANVEGKFALGPVDRLSDFEIKLATTPERIGVDTLAIVQPQGRLDLNGEVRLLDGAQQWDFKAQAKTFDPGAIVAAWPGSLSFTADTSGQHTAQGTGGGIRIDELRGQLRERPLQANGDLNISEDGHVAGTFAASSGESRIDIKAKPGAGNDLQVRVKLGALNEWLADSRGTVEADLRVRGDWPALAINGEVHARDFVLGDLGAQALEARVDIADLEAVKGEVTLDGTQLHRGATRFDTAQVRASGDGKAHTVAADLRGEALSARFALNGTREADNWRERIEQLGVALKDRGEWTLEQPVNAALIDGAAQLDDACLHAEQARVCIGGHRDAQGAGEARLQVEHLSLQWLRTFAASDTALSAQGEIAGGGRVSFDANNALHGEIRLTSADGRIHPEGDADTVLLAYRELAVVATLDGRNHRVNLNSEFADGGHARADVSISGAEQALAGQVDLALNDLAFVELASPQFAAVAGKLSGQGTISGTLAKPGFEGVIGLNDFATEIPRLGLKLKSGQLKLTADAARQYTIEGEIASGDGKLHIQSQGQFDSYDALRAEISGENFLAADIPGAKVVITPKLNLAYENQSFKLTGEVTIPKANIDLSRLPGGGSAKVSPDVVIVDLPPVKAQAATPLNAEITVVLGDSVKLKGYGLNGEVAGRLVVIDRPRRDTVGRGEIVINGTYKAYGQDLKIERGRLLFAGTAIDNPGLDLRAVRKLTEVTAGLSVKGTARQPELTVFSEPPLEQSDAISYLVTGRPLSALKSGESDMVGTATRALGTATGDLLAKSVGAKLGVDAGVADDGALGGAAFTVGKYLSPRLYLSYGVGLFTPGEVITLRYRLSRRWQLEAQSASTSTKAGIDYRYER